MLSLFFNGPNLFDAVILVTCIISSIFASVLPVTHLRYLGKTVGEKKPFVDFIKNLFSAIFFISEILLMLRSVVAAIFSLSFVVFLLYMVISGILLAVTLILWSRTNKKFLKNVLTKDTTKITICIVNGNTDCNLCWRIEI